MKLLKRLSTDTIVGRVPNLAKINTAETVKAEAEKREPVLINELPLFIIIGRVNGYKTKTTTYGESYGFTGDFDGVNVDTGEVSKSGVAYFPSPVDHAIKSAVDRLIADDKPVDMEIKVKIDALPHGGDRGYQFRASVAFADESDRAEEVRRRALEAFGVREFKPLGLTVQPETEAVEEKPTETPKTKAKK